MSGNIKEVSEVKKYFEKEGSEFVPNSIVSLLVEVFF